MKKTLWKQVRIGAGGFITAAIIIPVWEWFVAKVLDRATASSSALVGSISWAVRTVAPLEQIFIGIGIGLLIASFFMHNRAEPRTIGAAKPETKRESKPKGPDYQNLATRCMGMAQTLGECLRNPFLYDDYTTYLAGIYAMMVEMRKTGFHVPQIADNAPPNEKMEVARQYLAIMGNLLLGQHVEEAVHASEQMTRELPAKVHKEMQAYQFYN